MRESASGQVIMIRDWRISRANPSGLNLWFDPTCERPSLVGVGPATRCENASSNYVVPMEQLELWGVATYEGSDPEEPRIGKKDKHMFLMEHSF